MSILDDLKVLIGIKKAHVSEPAFPYKEPIQKKVLIVEDEALLAKALELKFKNAGFEVHKAVNGQQGFELTQSLKPQVVLLDLLMPVMDGKTMLRKLREIPEFKFLPVVILTNAGDSDNLRETTTYDNASAFLIKSSVSTDEILKLVNELINRASNA